MLRRAALLLTSLGAGCLSPGAPLPPPLPLVVQTFELTTDGSAPELLDVPYPIDLYREADGTLVDLPGISRIANGPSSVGLSLAYGRMNGFGVSTGAFFPFSGALDPASLTALSVGLIDIDPSSPAHGALISVEVRFDEPTGLLSISPRPGVVLREGNRYAAFVKNTLKDTQGRPISPDDDFVEVLTDTPDAIPGPSVIAAKQVLLPAAEELISLGVIQERSELLGLTAYTTQAITKDLVTIREMIDDPALIPAPQVQFPDAALIFDTTAKLDDLLGDSRNLNNVEVLGRDQAGGVAHAHIGVVASGLYPSPQFQPDDQGTNDDEQIGYDANGTPQLVNPARLLPLYVVLPDPAQSPMPANGYPVIIWQHGLGGDRTAVWDFGDAHAAAGFAVVAIDAVTHGSRFPNAQDTKNNLDDAGFLGDKNLRDGIAEINGDVNTAFFETLLNLAAIRDNFRQTIIDLMGLARLVREPSLDLSALAGVGSPFNGSTIKFDASQVYYYGSSFGGIVGGTFASLEPTLKGVVLNVPGGGLLLDLFPNSAGIGGSLLPNLKFLWALPQTFRFTRDDFFMQLGQGVLEGGDPLLYASHMLRDPITINGVTAAKKHILVFEVIGDELVSNAGTNVLAKALGLALASPFYPGGPFYPSGDSSGLPVCDSTNGECDGFVGGITATLIQESPSGHGTNLSSHSSDLSFEPGFPIADAADPFPRLTVPFNISRTSPMEAGVLVVSRFFQDIRDGQTPRVTHPAPPRADFDDDGVDDAVDGAPTNPLIQ